MAAKDKNVQPRVVSPIEVSPRLVEPKAIKYPFGGTPPTPQPTIDETWLYFTMPDGGTVTLTKNGSPGAVTLEYSLDNGSTWTGWTENGNVRSLTLSAGQTMHVRNTSATSVDFSFGSSSYYQFYFEADTYAGGNIMSLKCIDPSMATMTNQCFINLFKDCTSLITAADMGGVTSISGNGCRRMYYGCTNLSIVRIGNPDISASNCLANWLQGVAASGDFYCSELLTIPTGTSGIPSGWTRHNI